MSMMENKGDHGSDLTPNLAFVWGPFVVRPFCVGTAQIRNITQGVGSMEPENHLFETRKII